MTGTFWRINGDMGVPWLEWRGSSSSKQLSRRAHPLLTGFPSAFRAQVYTIICTDLIKYLNVHNTYIPGILEGATAPEGESEIIGVGT